MNELYPAIIIKDRYSGTYFGIEFTAWNLEANEVPDEISSGDGECMCFWDDYKTGKLDYLVGFGYTPTEAYYNLLMKWTMKTL